MLTEEKIKKNAAKFYSTGEKYNCLTPQLVDTLGVAIVDAPASTNNNLNNAFPGGLIDHILKVTKYCISLNETLPEPMRLPVESIIKVTILHQIGKVNLYKKLESPWHNERGIMYEFNDELISMKVGERSAHMAMANGIKLTDVEYQAIINFDKDDTDKQAKYYTSILGDLLKAGNTFAINEEKWVK
jgi:hypothetical protein